MKTRTQSAANVNLFTESKIGQMFQLVAKPSGRLIDVYHKVSDEKVQASDGRQWNVACTEIPGSHVVLVPQGARSMVPYFVS
jgi:hypothetical protein